MGKDRVKQTGKIINFPNLGDRLYDKGLDALKQKDFSVALQAFTQLREIEQSLPHVQAGIVISLLELGRLPEAKVESKRLLNEGIGDYFDNLQIYLTVLIQMHEFDEAAEIISAVFQEGEAPEHLHDHLNHLLELCHRMKNQPQPELERSEEPLGMIRSKLLSGQSQNQLKALQEIRAADINPYLQDLKQLLLDRHVSPELKTMILEILMEKQVTEIITVEKFKQTIDVAPVELRGLFEAPFTIQVLNLLDEKLGNENPTLYQIVKEIWHRHLFILFPFQPEPQKIEIWAAALHLTGYRMHGIELTTESVATDYLVDIREMEQAVKKINELEEVAFKGIVF